jgi:hypothetical protein
MGWPARLSALLPPFAYGWREVFIPLAVVLHNQHGLALITAGLAVAAARVGTWLWIRYRAPAGNDDAVQALQTARRAALLAGLVLLLLGLIPEEGPLGLLLWLAFGLAWPAVEAAAGAAQAPRRVAGAWLLLGLALAGPLALGPGAWLLAALYLLWAWQAGRGNPFPAAPAPSDQPRPAVAAWLPALLALATMTWLWLVPARLLAGGVPGLWCGVILVAHWLPRLIVGRQLETRPRGLATLAALLLALLIAALGFVASPWQMALLLAAQGALTGIIAATWTAAAAWEPPALTGPQALAEIAGPVVGVTLVALAGSPAPFVGGAAAALALAGVCYASSRAARA